MEARVIETYLKAVFNAGEWSTDLVTVGYLANRLGLAPSSVSETVRKLTERGLLTHARYGAISLTADGERVALGMVRKHRLIETFLVDYLGYGWDEVHDEAEVLEHAVSDTFIDRLDAKLGHPRVDPHGDPIPSADRSLADQPDTRLDDVPAGTQVRIDRVSDEDPELLRQLAESGIAIGELVTLAYADSGQVTLHRGDEQLTVPSAAARVIRVTPVTTMATTASPS
ncbi:MAG: metal-dependent transcriptional regulator [Microlunatus sp.]